jgi:hypothetical protein
MHFSKLKETRHQEIQRLTRWCEELSDILHPEQEYEEQEFPTSLRGLKTFFGISERDEGKLIVAIYNKDNEAKIQIKTETRNNKILDPRTGKYRKNQKFAKTKPHRFSSYSDMKRRYNPRSLNALKTRLKNLIFRAIPVNDTGFYNADDWCSLILRYCNDIDALIEYYEHGELVEGIYNLIKAGDYEQAPRSKRKVKVKPNFISDQMI